MGRIAPHRWPVVRSTRRPVAVKERDMKKLLLIIPCLTLSGCGAFSATTLRCGTDGDSSYLELVSAPQNVSGQTRAIGEMCAFAYEVQK